MRTQVKITINANTKQISFWSILKGDVRNSIQSGK